MRQLRSATLLGETGAPFTTAAFNFGRPAAAARCARARSATARTARFSALFRDRRDNNKCVRRWNTYLPRKWNERGDPTVTSGEAQELRYFRGRLASISDIIVATNAQLGSSVSIGAVLIDSESYYINWSNETQMQALQRKDDLVFNTSREFCDPALGCTVEQYNRGTIAPIFTLAKPAEGIPPDDAWTTWPGYPKCLGRGDTFATSLYSVPEYETTREGFRRTVANAATCNVSWVTPWIWLGGGGRRLIDATHDASISYDNRECANQQQ